MLHKSKTLHRLKKEKGRTEAIKIGIKKKLKVLLIVASLLSIFSMYYEATGVQYSVLFAVMLLGIQALIPSEDDNGFNIPMPVKFQQVPPQPQPIQQQVQPVQQQAPPQPLPKPRAQIYTQEEVEAIMANTPKPVPPPLKLHTCPVCNFQVDNPHKMWMHMKKNDAPHSEYRIKVMQGG